MLQIDIPDSLAKALMERQQFFIYKKTIMNYIKIKEANLVVNQFGLHADIGNNKLIPVDGLTTDDMDAYNHIKHRSGMNDTMFANTRIFPIQQTFNNQIITYYEN